MPGMSSRRYIDTNFIKLCYVTYQSSLPLRFFPVMVFLVGEVAAQNFVLNVGHLGRREPVVQSATSQSRR